MSPLKILTVELSESMASCVAEAARKRGVTLTEVVRAALEAYLNSNRPGGQGSCLDLAGSLAGSLAGPGDLSTGKQHLRDYGR